MELRINLVIVATLASVWLGLSAGGPVAALEPHAPRTEQLAELEDAFARGRGDQHLVRRLADRYLELDRPGLAIATLRAAEPALLKDPLLSHRLARAYEASGRMLDALATARVAAARCARSLGAEGAPSGTPVPRYGCDAGRLALLDRHTKALAHMVEWGVADPRRDPRRARLAYELAARKARIVSTDRAGRSTAGRDAGESRAGSLPDRR